MRLKPGIEVFVYTAVEFANSLIQREGDDPLRAASISLSLTSLYKFQRLGHRKDSFGTASHIRAPVRGRAGKLGFLKLGRLLKLGFFVKPRI